jgi:hypothetical protein
VAPSHVRDVELPGADALWQVIVYRYAVVTAAGTQRQRPVSQGPHLHLSSRSLRPCLAISRRCPRPAAVTLLCG